MGNFIIGYDFASYTIKSFSDENSNYPSSNLKLYSHLRRCAQTNTTAELTIVLDFSSALAAVGVMLDDVNFASAYVAGHTSDSWADPDFPEQAITIGEDDRVGRYKAHVALAAFNYRYMRVRVPNQAATDGAGAFRIGRLVILDTILTLAQNPAYGYDTKVDSPVRVNDFISGGHESVELGDYLEWSGSFSWNAISDANLDDVTDISLIRKNRPIVFYENAGDTSRVYVCRREESVMVTSKGPGIFQASTHKLREII